MGRTRHLGYWIPTFGRQISVVPVHFLNCAPIARNCALIARNCVPIAGYQVVQKVKKTKKCKTKFFWAGSQCASFPGRKHKLGNRFWFRYKARFQDWPQLAWVWANSMDISKSLTDPCVKWVGTLKSAHIHWNHQKVRRPSKNAQDGRKCFQPRVCQKKVPQWNLQRIIVY